MSAIVLLLNSLDAAGSIPPLDQKRTCVENFMDKLVSIKGQECFTFDEFARCFVPSYRTPADLRLLRSYWGRCRGMPQLGDKKVDNLLKELVLLAGAEVFDYFDENDYLCFLEVPVDRVIRTIYSRLLGSYMAKKLSHKDIDKGVRTLAARLFPSAPILFDDVWFWGHFTLRSGRLCRANQALLTTDPIIDSDFRANHDLEASLSQFKEIVSM